MACTETHTIILLAILYFDLSLIKLLRFSFLFVQKFAASRLVSTSVETKPSGSGGSFSWLTGNKLCQLPPLTLPLPDVKIPPPLSDVASLSTTQITTLPNGVKIASEFAPV
jgi:hypothetical protein